MLPFQCQVLLCLPGRNCLHSCEIRRSPQPELWKIPLPQPGQQKQEPQSQRQPQSEQFTWSRPRISPLLTPPQPLSLPFLKPCRHKYVAPLICSLMFLPLTFSRCLLVFIFSLFLSWCPCERSWYVDVTLTPPSPFLNFPLSSPSSFPFRFLSFSPLLVISDFEHYELCCGELQKC